MGLTDINLRLHVIGLTHNHGSLNEMSSTPLDQRPRRFGLGNDYNVYTVYEWTFFMPSSTHSIKQACLIGCVLLRCEEGGRNVISRVSVPQESLSHVVANGYAINELTFSASA